MANFLSALILFGLLVASAILWRRVIKAYRNKQPHFLSSRDSIIPPLGFSDVVAAVFIFAGSQQLAMTIITLITGIRKFDLANALQMTWVNFVMGAVQIISAALTIFYLWNRYCDPRAFGWYPKMLLRDLKLGCLGFLLFVPPMLALQAVLTNFWEYEHPTMDMVSSDSPLLTVLSAWWVATIVAPLNEEVLFRAVLLGWLMRCFAHPHDFLGGLIGGKITRSPSVQLTQSSGNARVNVGSDVGIDPWASPTSNPVQPVEYQHRKTWPPVFIVALLFALVHIGQGPAPIPIFFLGAGLCLMYRQTGSIVPCIVTHFLLNTFSMTVFTIQQIYFPMEEGQLEPVGIADVLYRLTFYGA